MAAVSVHSDFCFVFVLFVFFYSDFGAQAIKSVTVSIFSPSICHEVMGLET